jgi:hypothetical protein
MIPIRKIRKIEEMLKSFVEKAKKGKCIITLTTRENSITFNFKPDDLTVIRHFEESYENLRSYSEKVHGKELPPFKVLLQMIGMEREEREAEKLSYIG